MRIVSNPYNLMENIRHMYSFMTGNAYNTTQVALASHAVCFAHYSGVSIDCNLPDQSKIASYSPELNS